MRHVTATGAGHGETAGVQERTGQATPRTCVWGLAQPAAPAPTGKRRLYWATHSAAWEPTR
jgi:hypothetical protein